MSRSVMVLYECPIHHIRRLVIELAETGAGVRVAGSKCCERQYGTTLDRWPLTARQWEELAEESTNAALDEARP